MGGVYDVRDPLRVLKPPSVAVLAVEVQVDILLRDAESHHLWVFLFDYGQFFEQCLHELARLSLHISLDVEHHEGLLEASVAEDVGELRVDLHVEEDVPPGDLG